MQKFAVAWLLVLASLLIVKPSFAFDGVEIAGTAEKLQVKLSNATVDNALVALRSAFNFTCSCAAPLDRRVTGIYRGNIRRVLSRLLEGYDYVIRTSPSGAVEAIVLGANASLQPSPGYASSPAAAVDDESRGRPQQGLSQPNPDDASSPPPNVDDERRGRPPRERSP